MAKGIQTAGEFQLDQLKLVTTSGLEVNLTTSVVGLTLFEDIFSMTVSGTVAIAASVNLASHGPILGQEYLYLKISTPTFKDESAVIDFSKNAFLVSSISKREKVTDGVQIFTLNFVSQELIKNQRLKVNQSLTNTWSNIVEKMLTDPAYIDTKKKINIEPTTGIKKFVAPNIRPLDVIVLGMKQAVSEYKGEPTYLFYETLKGFNFRTLASHYNDASQLEYVVVFPGTNPVGSKGYDVLNELKTVISYEIVANNDSVVNYRTGVFGSELITHDIISKSYSTKTYNYHDEFENESHIVSGVTAGKLEFPLASEIKLNEKGLRISDFPARTFVMPTSLSGGTRSDSQHQTENNTSPYMAYDPHKWVQRRNSQMVQLENALQVNIVVHGNTLINAGDKVILNLPWTSSAEPPRNEKYDRFYKGPFLIKRIRHDFNMSSNPQRHMMYMSLVKDSLEEELDASGTIEPTDTSPNITRYKYN